MKDIWDFKVLLVGEGMVSLRSEDGDGLSEFNGFGFSILETR
jgi:hypothetical protein